MARNPLKLRLETLESRIVPVGQLDPAFGVGGVVVTDASPTHEGDGIVRVAVLDNGQILTIGTAFGTSGSGFRPVFSRYDSDGSLDLTFGKDGFAYDSAGFSDISDAALQADGKIVVVGQIPGPGTIDFGVARYNPDGTRDLTFGRNGFAQADIDRGKRDIPTSVAIQADGKIVVGGISAPDGTSNFQAALARFNPNGTLDTAFANQGTLRTAFSTQTYAYSLALQDSDGSIYLGGSIFRPGTGDDFALLRFDAAGKLDPSFGSDGLVAIDLGSGDVARKVLLQPDGNLVLAGEVGPNVGLARLLADGSLDDSFGTGGIVVENVAGLGLSVANVKDLKLQFDGKLVLVGTTNPGGGKEDFLILRYQADGSRDTAFGTDGATISDLFGSRDIPQAAVMDGAGGILVVGSTIVPDSTRTDSVLTRYITNRAPVAEDDTASTAPGQPVTIDVLANDEDPDGDPLSIVDVTQPAGGVVVINPDGTLTYTPGQNFSGTDEFTYTISDGELFATATVQVEVTPAPGPQVVEANGLRFGGAALAYVTFSEAIDPSTFDASDVVVRDAQGQAVSLGWVRVAALNERTFLITFENPPLTRFSLVIGPDIRSVATGQSMNQNGDGENGQPDDAFVFDFGRFGGKFGG
jgi:uncharacterized delta-60 repeat protein